MKKIISKSINNKKIIALILLLLLFIIACSVIMLNILIQKENMHNNTENNSLQKEIIMYEFNDKEIEAAQSVVKEYFSTSKSEGIILLSIYFNSKDKLLNVMLKNYSEMFPPERIIILRVNFEVSKEYKENDLNKGIYKDWMMILTRKDKNSPWIIFDQGY